ncbi:MAG: hypothetical protein ACI9W6_000664, partial [Motiliproteus sp.]
MFVEILHVTLGVQQPSASTPINTHQHPSTRKII